jgi:putative transmembrane protein PGPGW
MFHWVQDHRVLLYWLAAASAAASLATLVLTPALIVRIPPDYFAHQQRPPSLWAHRHPMVRLTLAIGKNVLGWTFLVAGLGMLVLPGQGLLTLLIGFLMLDFPRKYRFEKWLISRRRVSGGINWLRRRAGREPLQGSPRR